MKAAAVVRAEVPVTGAIPRPKRGERALLDLRTDRSHLGLRRQLSAVAEVTS